VELGRRAAESGFTPVVAAGGDGSIGEVLNGLMEATPDGCDAGPLGIIPLGSADDFADMIRLEKDVQSAVRSIHAGFTRLIDVGTVNGRYFVNNSAVGLEPMVTITQAGMKRIKGTPRYVVAALTTIARHKPWQMQITWDSGEYGGPATLVSVGNTRRTGGAFYMTPSAEPDDGLLDFVYGGGMSRLRLLRLLPATFDGSHVSEPEIGYERTTRLAIECDPPTPVQADGELFELEADRIEYSILPGRLRVIVPQTIQDAQASKL
jgi:YegS/Rv2252/BmrU family lipid kinase